MTDITQKTTVQLGVIITCIGIIITGVFWAGRLSGQVENNTIRINGIDNNITEIKQDIKTLLQRN